MIIKILGGGCPKCNKLTQNAQIAAEELGLDYSIEKITDFTKYADYGVMITPALVIDDKLICSGTILSSSEIKPFMK